MAASAVAAPCVRTRRVVEVGMNVLGRDEETVRAFPVAHGLCPHCGRTESVWTPGTIITAFHRWHLTHGKAPSSGDWRKATVDNPASDAVVRMFGSFENARTAAGLSFRRLNFAGEWTRKEILDAILRWVFLHGRIPTYHDWRTPPDGFPSVWVVRRHFGRWNRAIVQAGYVPHDRGRRTVAA